MEELVLSEAVAKVAEVEASSNHILDLGDIAAYALNRLPPLYATTEEGAVYQRERALADLFPLIAQQVKEAIERNVDRPEFFPERSTIGQKGDGVLSQISSLLQAYAPEFESKP